MYIYLLIFVGPRFCLDCGSTAELQVVFLSYTTLNVHNLFSSSIKKNKNLKTFMK